MSVPSRLLLTLACVLVTVARGAAPVDTAALLNTVRAGGDPAARARALQQLAVAGSAEAVPAAEALVADEQLGQYARDVLEQMPGAEAGAALRRSLEKTSGRALLGVIGSLGARGEPESVEPLRRVMVAGGEPAVAVLAALGRIGGAAAVQELEAALVSVAPATRAAAAEGLLVSADRRLAAGDRAGARSIFERVRSAGVAGVWRVAAARGAVLTTEGDVVPAWLALQRSDEPEMRGLALSLVRELRHPGVNAALIAEAGGLEQPERQAAAIFALVDVGEPRALSFIETKARSGPVSLRVVALRALGRAGGPSSVPVLLQALGEAGAEAVVEAAADGLARIPARETGPALLAAAIGTGNPMKVRLIGLLGDRRDEAAVPALLGWASGTDAEVAKAALRALGVVLSPSGLPRLIELAVKAPDDDRRLLADRAIVTTAMKIVEPARRPEALLSAFRAAPDPAQRAALLRPLGVVVRTMGPAHGVFFAVRAALQDSDPGVRGAAVRCLAEWPDATPAVALIEFAARPDVPDSQREAAVRGVVRMTGRVAAGQEISPLDVVRTLAAAGRAARGKAEKMQVVAGLGASRRAAALPLIVPYLDDTEVRPEAALAVVQLASTPGVSAADPAFRTALERAAAVATDDDVRRRAARLARGEGVPKTAAAKGAKAGKAGKAAAVVPATKPGTLFNGRDLSGWEGDPGTWRVEDGVIKGGSLLGNPRNEFLATTRPYRNFTLRLEYRLNGTEGFVNGGVQVRSVRIEKPANEMSGYQADIGAGHSGSLYDESRRKRFLARADAAQVRRLERVGEWNAYEIRCDGPRVEILLNGERTLLFTEDDAGVAADGLVALQIHGNCKAEIAFRGIVIEER